MLSIDSVELVYIVFNIAGVFLSLSLPTMLLICLGIASMKFLRRV